MDKKRPRSASTGESERQWASGRKQEVKSRVNMQMEKRSLALVRDGQLQKFRTTQINARKNELSDMQSHAKNTGQKVAGHNMDLAGYMTRRNVDNRSVEGSDLSNLYKGHQTVVETRQKLGRGRGNVTSDIKKSGDLSTRFMEAGRDLDTFLQRKHGQDSRISGASTAEFVRAGNCQEHGDVSTHGHAQRLESNQTIHTRSLKDPGDHVWSEVRGSSGKARRNDVILDAWAFGPAVLREDAYFAKHHKGSETQYSYNKSEAMTANKGVSSLNKKLAKTPWVGAFVTKRVDKLTKQKSRASDPFDPTSVLDKSFMSRTDKRMTEPVDLSKVLSGRALKRAGGADTKIELRNEIRAVGVARQLGSNVSQAVQQAPAILRATKKLPKN